ncbi:hypothetical protein ACFWY9_23165 [Amycolatopsis sp. NPDC059027]|uniref:hypothetical protein n=1 Tax=unclassified Amycolatopsis TaxID=2618356 RepID=UPI00366EFF96
MSEEMKSAVRTNVSGTADTVVQVAEQHGDTNIHLPRKPGSPWLIGAMLFVVIVAAAVVVYLEHERLSARSAPESQTPSVQPPAAGGVLDCGPTAQPIYSGSYRGCEIKNANMGQKTHVSADWGSRRRTLLVIGQGYQLYVADNDGPFSTLGKVAASGGGGLFFTYTGDNAGYVRFLATDSKRYCLDLTAAPVGSGKPATRGDWYVC